MCRFEVILHNFTWPPSLPARSLVVNSRFFSYLYDIGTKLEPENSKYLIIKTTSCEDAKASRQVPRL
jgi:hypothetical protein